MKMILAGVAFAALLATPVLAQPLRASGRPATGLYLNNAQARGGFQDPSFTALTRDRNSMQQSLCSTAHDFCPDFHGDNN